MGRPEEKIAGGMLMKIMVECYSGYRGEEIPRALWLGERRVGVEEIIDRWLAPDHRYFKFRGDDRGVYIIRHDAVSLQWEVTFYQDPAIAYPNWNG
jgi:hypothetical protein